MREVMSMPESRYNPTPGDQVIAVLFQMKAPAYRILDSLRQTDISLLTVFGD